MEDNIIHFLDDASSRNYYILEKEGIKVKKKNSIKKN